MTGDLDGERWQVLGNSMAKEQESRLVRGKINGGHVGLLALSCYLILDIGGTGGSRDHAPLSPRPGEFSLLFSPSRLHVS